MDMDISVKYESPEISTTLSSKEVQDLPILTQTGRGPSSCLFGVLAPGSGFGFIHVAQTSRTGQIAMELCF